MIDVSAGQHLAHIGTAGRVADHGRAAADERDGFVACLLQTLHKRQRHEMPGSQAVGSAVEADVKGGLACIDHIADLFLIRHLGDQPAGDKFFINTHYMLLIIDCL